MSTHPASTRAAANSDSTGAPTRDWHPAAGSVYAIDWRRDGGMHESETSFAPASNRPTLVAHSMDRDTGIWMLCVRHNGEAILRLNDRIVGILPGKKGAPILTEVQCQFESAARFIEALSSNLQTLMGDTTRTEFEFAVANWIPRGFQL